MPVPDDHHLLPFHTFTNDPPQGLAAGMAGTAGMAGMAAGTADSDWDQSSGWCPKVLPSS